MYFLLLFFPFISAIIYNYKALRFLSFFLSIFLLIPVVWDISADYWFYTAELSGVWQTRWGGDYGCDFKMPSTFKDEEMTSLLYNCAACTVLHKMLSQWTRSPAFETNFHSLCSTWIENIIAYLCSLGLPTVLSDRWVYILKENFTLYIFWLNKYATHLNSLCFIISAL